VSYKKRRSNFSKTVGFGKEKNMSPTNLVTIFPPGIPIPAFVHVAPTLKQQKQWQLVKKGRPTSCKM
jgi:hypothetical protein